MIQTPFQRALDGLEDAIFRLPLSRRRWCLAQVLRVQRRAFADRHHEAIWNFVAESGAYRDRQIVSIAQAHRVRLWWLPLLLAWNSLTSGIDVAEYALAWFVVRQRWIPRRMASWTMATAAVVASDIRRAPETCLPEWVRVSFRAPVIGAKVCAWQLGIVRWWKWWPSQATTSSESLDLSWLHGALRLGLAAATLWCLCCAPAVAGGVKLAALSSSIVWEVQTGGDDSNGGGFKAGASGTDWSQQTMAHATLSAASVVNATTTKIDVDAGDYTVASTDVGNILQITGGTATAGFYEITAASGGQWTLDRSAGTAGQTVVGAMGGCLLTPGKAAGAKAAGNVVYLKTGTYTLSTTSSNVAGGIVNDTSANALWEGYSATRGDLAGSATIAVPGAGVTSVTMFAGNSGVNCRNFILDGNSKTSIRGMAGGNSYCYLVTVENCTNSGMLSTQNSTRCLTTGNTSTGQGFNAIATLFGCESYGHGSGVASGIRLTAGGQLCAFSLSYNNTGTLDGLVGAASVNFVNCVSYGNGRHGVEAGAGSTSLVNVLAEGNGGYGYGTASGALSSYLLLTNCGSYNNTSGSIDTNLSNSIMYRVSNFLTGSASFFVDPANGNFALNTTTGGGALARAAGYPGTFPRGTTTGYLDAGAVQQDLPISVTVANVAIFRPRQSVGY